MILKRANCYYYRWQIPADLKVFLKKNELVRTLKTSNKLIALQRAIPLDNNVQKIKQVWIAYQMKELTQDNFQETLKELWLQASNVEGFSIERMSEETQKANRELKLFKEYAVGVPDSSRVVVV